MKPVISIVTPYRNAEPFIAGFVCSMRSQILTEWVCIMVDDGSTDNGPHKLHDLVKTDQRFQLKKNTFTKSWPGPASARNCGLSYVQTELIAFCDIDDRWHPQKLSKQINYHTRNNLDISVSAYARFYTTSFGNYINKIVCPPPTLSFDDLLKANHIPMLTVVLSSKLIINPFKNIAHEDYAFWIDNFSLQSPIRYGCLNYVLAYYQIHDQNLSGKKTRMPFWIYSVYKSCGYSSLRSLKLLSAWSINMARKYIQTLVSPNKMPQPLESLLNDDPIQVSY